MYHLSKVEPPDRKWQYLLFAAEPYETIAFKVSLQSKLVKKSLTLGDMDGICRNFCEKVPSREVDKSEQRFWSHWNK